MARKNNKNEVIAQNLQDEIDIMVRSICRLKEVITDIKYADASKYIGKCYKIIATEDGDTQGYGLIIGKPNPIKYKKPGEFSPAFIITNDAKTPFTESFIHRSAWDNNYTVGSIKYEEISQYDFINVFNQKVRDVKSKYDLGNYYEENEYTKQFEYFDKHESGMDDNELLYNPLYAIYKTFSKEELNDMSKEELLNLYKLGSRIMNNFKPIDNK